MCSHLMRQKDQSSSWRNGIHENNLPHSNHVTYIYYCWWWLVVALLVPGTELSPVPNIITFNHCDCSMCHSLLLFSVSWWRTWGSGEASHFFSGILLNDRDRINTRLQILRFARLLPIGLCFISQVFFFTVVQRQK